MKTIKKILCSALILLPQVMQPSSYTANTTIAPSIMGYATNTIIMPMFIKSGVSNIINVPYNPSVSSSNVFTLTIQGSGGAAYSPLVPLTIKIPKTAMHPDGIWLGILISLDSGYLVNYTATIYSTKGTNLGTITIPQTYLTINSVHIGCSATIESNIPTKIPIFDENQSAVFWAFFLHPNSSQQQSISSTNRSDLASKMSYISASSVFGIALQSTDITSLNFIQSELPYSLGSIKILNNIAELQNGIYIVLSQSTATTLTYNLYDSNGKSFPSSTSNSGTITAGAANPALSYNQVIANSVSGSCLTNEAATTTLPSNLPIVLFLQQAPNGTVTFPTGSKKLAKKLDKILKDLKRDASTSTNAILGFELFQTTTNATAAINAGIDIIVDLYDLINKTNPKLAQQLPKSIQTLTKPGQ